MESVSMNDQELSTNIYIEPIDLINNEELFQSVCFLKMIIPILLLVN